MADLETKETTTRTERTNGLPEVVQRRWFCVARSPEGSFFKNGAESPASFIDALNNASLAWVDYVAMESDFGKEAVSAATQLGFTQELVASLTGEARISYQDFDNEVGIKFPSIQVRKFEVQPYSLLMLIKKNFILTIHPVHVDRRFFTLRRYADTILKKIPVEAITVDRLSMLMMRIIDEINERNFEHLRELEERSDELNSIMMDPYTPRARLGPEIYNMKHALITYLNALWDSVHVIHVLRYGDAELLTDDPKLLDRLEVLADNVSRQIGLAEHLSEVLASGLEVLQSIYNNQLQNLNNRFSLVITYLTIIGTALLVPNTLATMLSNAVFDIGPKDMWWYLTLMIGSTVIATGAVYWWVRKRGWIPKKMD